MGKEGLLQPSNVFDPQSPLAKATVDLFNITLVISAVVFALVSGLVIYCLAHFRGGVGQSEPRQVRGHKRLEIVWTVLPCLVLVYLFVLTVKAMQASDPPRAGDPDVIVIG